MSEKMHPISESVHHHWVRFCREVYEATEGKSVKDIVDALDEAGYDPLLPTIIKAKREYTDMLKRLKSEVFKGKGLNALLASKPPEK